MLWDYKIPELKNRLKYSNYSFLNHIDFKNPSPEILFKLNPGAPYYFYHILKKIGLTEQSYIMLRIGSEKSELPWKKEAVQRY